MQTRSLANSIAVAAATMIVASPVWAAPVPPPPPNIFDGPALLVLDNSDTATALNQGVLQISTANGKVKRLLDHTAILQAQVDAGVIPSIAAGDINFREAGTAFVSDALFFVEADSDSIMKLSSDGTVTVHIKASDFPSGTRIRLKGLAVRELGRSLVVVNDATASLWEFRADTPGVISEAVSEAALVAANGGNSVDLDGGVTSDSIGNLYVPSDDETATSPQGIFKVAANGDITALKSTTFVDIDNFLTYDQETDTIVVADDGDPATGGIGIETAILRVTQSGGVSTIADKTALDGTVGTKADLEGGLVFGTLQVGVDAKRRPIVERRLFVAESGSNSILAIDTSVSPGDISVFVSRDNIAAQIDYLPGALPELEGGISFIPEPSSLLLMGLSGIGAWGWNQRKRRKGICRKRSLTSSTQTTT